MTSWTSSRASCRRCVVAALGPPCQADVLMRSSRGQLRAFEKLLQDYPQWIGNVVLIQVTSPALSDSPKLERQVSELVAHINGEYGSLDFIPVHH